MRLRKESCDIRSKVHSLLESALGIYTKQHASEGRDVCQFPYEAQVIGLISRAIRESYSLEMPVEKTKTILLGAIYNNPRIRPLFKKAIKIGDALYDGEVRRLVQSDDPNIQHAPYLSHGMQTMALPIRILVNQSPRLVEIVGAIAMNHDVGEKRPRGSWEKIVFDAMAPFLGKEKAALIVRGIEEMTFPGKGGGVDKLEWTESHYSNPRETMDVTCITKASDGANNAKGFLRHIAWLVDRGRGEEAMEIAEKQHPYFVVLHRTLQNRGIPAMQSILNEFASTIRKDRFIPSKISRKIVISPSSSSLTGTHLRGDNTQQR
ncbi:MAG: hypothetical protein ACOY3I_03000 [Verrucomicrobiota bacterium]